MESFLLILVVGLMFSELWVMVRDIRRMQRKYGDHQQIDSDGPCAWDFGDGSGWGGGDLGGDFGG